MVLVKKATPGPRSSFSCFDSHSRKKKHGIARPNSTEVISAGPQPSSVRSEKALAGWGIPAAAKKPATAVASATPTPCEVTADERGGVTNAMATPRIAHAAAATT